MKLKIEFFRKCFNCQYETPNTNTLIWDNGNNINQSLDFQLTGEKLGIMLGQLHEFNNIVCENCGTRDELAFAVIKVNDEPYEDIDDEDSIKEFEIHNEILEIAPTSLILFHLKNGNYKIAEVFDEMTSLMSGEKSYMAKVYFECKEIDDIENFSLDNGMTIQEIDLTEIKEVERYISLDDIYN